MSVNLYIRDNTTGSVREYGTSCHDALVLGDDGELHYLNLQNYTGTRYPEEGYSFCLPDGSDPREDPEDDGILDIGGDFFGSDFPEGEAPPNGWRQDEDEWDDFSS